VVGVNDLIPRRSARAGHATHFLMTRAYAQRPACSTAPTRTLVRGLRPQLYVDDELIATARKRGVYAYAPTRLTSSTTIRWRRRRRRHLPQGPRALRAGPAAVPAAGEAVDRKARLMDATIAIATFGAQAWLDRALNETVPAAREHGVPVVHAHGRTLARRATRRWPRSARRG
jgi:hypothetical protein